MMKILKNLLENDNCIRTEKDFPIKGMEYLDIVPLLLDAEIYKEITNIFVKEISNKNVQYIVSPESRGFFFGCPVAEKMKLGFIPVRKKGKLPPTTVQTTFEYVKEYGKDELELPKLINNEEYKDKNFYIIDDIYATGNTVQTSKKEIEKLGGNVVGISVVINIKELNNDELFSILDVNEE